MKTRTVGVTSRIVEAEWGELRDAVSHDMIAYVNSQSWTPVVLPNHMAVSSSLLEELDVLLLTGGDNIGVHPIRDAVEFNLIAQAIERGQPILGVCRGMQMLNRYFGGTERDVDGHVATQHQIVFESSRLFKGGSAVVNSFHKKAIGALGKGLRATASSADGVVEALEHDSVNVFGVMWHPERGKGLLEPDSLLERIRNESV